MNRAENQYFVSTYHLTDAAIPSILDFIDQIKPLYMDGYPSAFEILARWMLIHNRQVHVPAIITTAETLRQDQRELIQEAFGARVYSYYSSSEGAPFIVQMSDGTLRELKYSGIIEFLKNDGSPAKPGEPAQMVVTSFFQRSMPLIRYKIGDIGIRPEPAINSFGQVAAIIGRQDDLVYTTERGWVGRLGPVFKSIPPSIIESQIAQVGEDSFEIRYVPDEATFREEHLKVVVMELKKRLGDSVQVVVRKVHRIERGPNGKFKAVVREM